MKLGSRPGKTVHVTLPGTQKDGPLVKIFEGIDHRDVIFSTALPPEVGAISNVEKKLIVNPNAMMLIAFEDEDETQTT